ncbi:MAG: hypothetical protein Q8L27_01340 [archaeon]|nr:hypothetical protein [archaeon]
MNELTLTKQEQRAIIAIIVGAMVITLAILMSIIFEFGIVGNLVTSWILTTAYAIFAFFLIEPVIKFNPVQFIEKPVIHEVIREIQVPIENKTIEVIDRPVIQEVQVEVPVDREVIRYIERKHKKLNIPTYKFIGSTESKSYHKRSCRFSKLIKRKYKNHSNTKTFFKRKHYHACKACINRNKKK